MKSFSYKQQKSVAFWMIDKNNIFWKSIKNEFEIKYGWNIVKISIVEQNKIYDQNLNELYKVFKYIDSLLNIIFQKENYHNFSFSYEFSLLERKKLQTWRIAEKALKDKIWKKYVRQYENYLNNINIFSAFLEENEESLSRLSHIVRVIRYIKWDLEKISNCLQEYLYQWENTLKNTMLGKFKNFISDNTNDFFQLLNYYSKLDKEQSEEYKIALNPTILNTHSEINQEHWKADLKKLKEELKKLQKQNDYNKNIKRSFEEDLEAYINYILYEKWFFKESKNKNYKNITIKIYEKYQSYMPNKVWSALKYYEQYVLNFIQNNRILIEESHCIDEEILNSYLNQSVKEDNLKKFLSKNINFIQLKTFLYQLTWKRAEIKENNNKTETKQDFQKLSEYIRTIKKEINFRLTNPRNLYCKFIKPGGRKSQIASRLWQVYGEYIQKSNFDKELKWYTHFWFIVRKGNRFFIKPYEKEQILNENWGFTFQDAKNLIQQNVDNNGEYETFIFQSLTLKWLLKLIFIKNAFKYSFKEEYKDIYDIWQRKIYYKNTCASKKFIEFLLKTLFSEFGKKLFSYVKNNFKMPNHYEYFYDFEEDLLRNSYTIHKDMCSFDEKDLIELDVVDRKFEFEEIEPRLKRQNDIHMFVEWFFNTQNFDFLRLLPEIKIFIRYQKFFWEMWKSKVNGKSKDEIVYEKEIWIKERFYKTISKASFMLELNPCEIHKNPENSKALFRKCIVDSYENKKDFHIISVDIWENSFATLWVYDVNLKPQKIDVKWLDSMKDENQDKYIVDITDLQVSRWDIIQKNTKNSEKYKSYKQMFDDIVLSQIYLKDILERMWVIEIANKNYSFIQQGISQSISSISGLCFHMNEINQTIKDDFPCLKKWLKTFLLNYIKNLHNWEDKTINIADYYHDIFQKLELQKVINFKDAFGANFVGVIKEILKKYPWIIVFESLHAWNTYSEYNNIIRQKIEKISSEKSKEFRTFWTYVGMYVAKSLVQSFSKIIDIDKQMVHQWIYFDKNYETTIWKKKYYNNWILFFVDEKNTSSACPVCNWKFIKELKENWEVIENDNINKLFWHGKWEEFEKIMHHFSENNGVDYKNYLEQAKKTQNDKCDYHMKNNPCGFDFIKSWDDLATYNIAKKAKEYLGSLHGF